MTAPTKTRQRPATAPGRQRRTQPGGTKPAEPSRRARLEPGSKARSTAAERAYARRAARAEEMHRAGSAGSAGAGEGERKSKLLRLRLPHSRASFVLLMMALLAGGVAATLWLSTQAIAGSYQLERLHERNNGLAEQAEQLQRAVTTRESPAWLARQAEELGMVFGGFPARIVVAPDGSTRVIGEPQKAEAPPPPEQAPQNPPKPEGDPATPDEQASGGQPEAPAEGDPPPQQRAAGDQRTTPAGEGG